MGFTRRSPVAIFGVAVLSVAAALSIRIIGRPFFGDASPFLFCFAALSFTAWYGGLLPGLLATILGVISIDFCYLPLVDPEGAIDTGDIFDHCVFLLAGSLISLLIGKLHRNVDRSVKAERELEKRVQERTAELADLNRILTTERNKLLGILDQIPDAVYIVNPDHGIEYANPAMEREFGKPGNQKCYQYTHRPRASLCDSCRNPEIFEGKSFSTEWSSPKNGKIYDCFEAPIVTQTGKIGKLKIMHDITKMKKAEEELSSRHRHIQRLSSELLNAQESERLRISKELHDELGQALTLIKMKVDLIDGNVAESQHLLKKYCKDASGHVDLAIENMRRLSRDLSPVAVETLGITIALSRLVEEFNRAGGIQITAEIDDIDDLLSFRSSILLYRVLQEGLNNIAKHSRASAATLTIAKMDAQIYFELMDNGKGLDPEQEGPAFKLGKGGFGLGIMTERVRTLGGSLEIQSRKNEGTRLSFSLPLEKERSFRAAS